MRRTELRPGRARLASARQRARLLPGPPAKPLVAQRSPHRHVGERSHGRDAGNHAARPSASATTSASRANPALDRLVLAPAALRSAFALLPAPSRYVRTEIVRRDAQRPLGVGAFEDLAARSRRSFRLSQTCARRPDQSSSVGNRPHLSTGKPARLAICGPVVAWIPARYVARACTRDVLARRIDLAALARRRRRTSTRDGCLPPDVRVCGRFGLVAGACSAPPPRGFTCQKTFTAAFRR